MPRIRTVKPEFFRHEGLQELEAKYPGCHPMLVFAALWGHCDKNGTFEWRPRQLKLDILPFLPFNMDQSLEALVEGGFVKKFEALGKQWGSIDHFPEHQRISGSEATDPAKYPEYQEPTKKEAAGKQRGSTGDQLVSQEGKGREGNIPGAETPPAPGVGGYTPKRKPRAIKCPIPTDFAISDSTREWARGLGLEQYLEAHLDYFRDYAASSGKEYADWDAAFRNAVKGDWGGVRKNYSPRGGERRLAI